MAIMVFLADDNLLVGEGVRALIELSDDLQVVLRQHDPGHVGDVTAAARMAGDA